MLMLISGLTKADKIRNEYIEQRHRFNSGQNEYR